MTTDLLARIAKALEGVTPGPWHSAGGYLTVRDPNDSSFTMTIYHIDELGQREPGRAFQAVPFARSQDARFIAAARTLLPEAAEALKIAVEALEFVANIDRMQAQQVVVSAPDLAEILRWYLTECRDHARDALSRLTSAAEDR